MPKETALRTMDEYVDFYTSKINDKEKVMQNTYKLNEMLHRHSIPEKLRSQFVGPCLLALKNGLDYSTPSLTAAQIRTRIIRFSVLSLMKMCMALLQRICSFTRTAILTL